jgi:arginine utilization protein RocB
MACTAFDDTVEFLFRHPWATNESDNPVELLRDLHAEHEAALDEIDELERRLEDYNKGAADPEALRNARAQVDELLAFVRRLRDAQKISDLEFETAKRIARAVPSHRAEIG